LAIRSRLSSSGLIMHFAIIWYHRMIKPDDDNRLLIANNEMQKWLADSFNNNRSWNTIVSDMLLAQGDRETKPETTFMLAHVDDNKGRHDPAPNKITTAASKLFLGVRLECCECHNHPFNTMKQTDFWGIAAFFGDTHSQNASQRDAKDGAVPGIRDGGTVKKGKKDEKTLPHAFGQIVIPDSKGKTVKAKFLNGPEAAVYNHPSLRKLLVNWMTAPTNKYFAQAAVNKLWANFFGTGIVNPIDDMDPDKATHPELLKLLTDEFVASGYDQKHMIRCICESRTYQRTSAVLPENKDDDKLYSHMKTKVMSADMLYDSLEIVLERSAGEAISKKDAKKDGKKGGGTPRAAFRKFFHAEADDDVGVVEDYTHGIPQVLRLMNSALTNYTGPIVGKAMKQGEPEKVIESLYLTVLSRVPTAKETEKMKAYAETTGFSAEGYRDLLWVLLNSAEFMFNH